MTDHDLLTLRLSNLSEAELTALIERIGGAHWMSYNLTFCREKAAKLRREAEEMELRATRALAESLLEEWTADEIEAAK